MARHPAPQKYPAINDNINGNNHAAEDQLHVVIKAGRIQDGHKIVFDEATLVSGLPRSPPELLFPRGERTQPALEFQQRTPYNRGQVQEYKPAPFQYQQATGHHKTHKAEMEYQQQVCSNSVIHCGRIIKNKEPG